MAAQADLPSIKHLRAFEAVAQTGSALAAAKLLRISQPAVTYSLDRLEHDLGVRLFDRSAAGSFLTAEGARFQLRTGRLFRQIFDGVADASGAGGRAQKAEALAWRLRDNEVRALIAIWREGSFRNAAQALDVAEPSLQRPARELERMLRATLYRRTATGMETNGAGAELARRLSLAFDEIWSGIEEIGAAARRARPSLRVGVLALSPRMVLARAMNALLSPQSPQQVEVIEGPYQKMAVALRNGEIDLLFGALRAPSPYSDLQEEELLADPYAIVCRAGHPLLTSPIATTAQIEACGFIFPTQGLPRRAVLDRLIETWGIHPKSRIETSCLATILAQLRTSDRLTLLSRWHVGLDGLPDVRCLDSIDVGHEPRFVGLTMRRDWRPTPFQSAFMEQLRATAEACRSPAPDKAAARKTRVPARRRPG